MITLSGQDFGAFQGAVGGRIASLLADVEQLRAELAASAAAPVLFGAWQSTATTSSARSSA
ncbi:MAG: hypothetical protein ACYC1P_00310 [Gaiellaceae bacterium]